MNGMEIGGSGTVKQKNAMEKEIDKLSQQWEEFVDSDGPILHWLIKPGEVDAGI